MPRITGPQSSQLLEAMLDAFDQQALTELLRFRLNRELDRIVAASDNLRAATERVIAAANREGWIADLLRAARDERQALGPLVDELLTHADPPPPDADAPPLPADPPPGSRLTFPRNAAFTGRTADLLALAAHFLPPQPLRSSAPPLILTGIGGTGKSQLANEFCYRYGRWFEAVHWVTTTAGTEPEIAACGRALGIRPWPDAEPEQVAATLRTWADDPLRLVVLDNLEEPEILRDWLARLGSVRVLVTARNEDWPAADLGLTLYPLGLFRPEDSRALLRKLAPRLAATPDAGLDALAERLGGLPLALDLAGRYLKDEADVSPADYLAELDAQEGSALRHESLAEWATYNPTKHATSLMETFLISWQRLLAEPRAAETAARAFRACGYCAPNAPIPVALLEGALGAADDPARREVTRGLRALDRLGLLEAGEAGPRIHPLVRDFARSVDEKEPMLPPLAAALAHMADVANETGLPAQAASLRSHLEAVTPAAEAAGLRDAIRLWTEIGRHLRRIAAYADATKAYEQALRLAEATLGPEHCEIAQILNHLANNLRDQQNLPQAQKVLERALRVGEVACGSQDPTVAWTLTMLADVLRAYGDTTKAQQYIERALRIDEAFYGLDHSELVFILEGRARIRLQEGDVAGARADFERALRLHAAIEAPNPYHKAILLNNLGMVAHAQPDLDAARRYFREALILLESIFPPGHPYTEKARANLLLSGGSATGD